MITSTPIVDAHFHLWDTSAFDLSWLEGVPELVATYTPADYVAAIDGMQVHGAVAVQAGETAAEAAWLLSTTDVALHRDFPETRVVLQYAPSPAGWLGAVHTAAAEAGRRPSGIRLPLLGEPSDWSGLGGLHQLTANLENRGMTLELLLRPDQLDVVDAIAMRYPRLTIVLCHLGLNGADPDAVWRASISRLAARRSVCAKVSGLFSSSPPNAADLERASRSVGFALEEWGSDRLMFGSDWPMSARAGSYFEVVAWTKQALASASTTEIETVFTHTAARIYTLASQHGQQLNVEQLE